MVNRIGIRHAGGGKQAKKLLNDIFLSKFRSISLQKLTDATVVSLPSNGRMAITAQCCDVNPPFFPGGDIGRLTVFRAVNNLVVQGASPRYAAVSFIIHDGFLVEDLEKIVSSIAYAASQATIEIVAGDTRIIENSGQQGIYINVTAIGIVTDETDPLKRKIMEGDLVIVNNYLAEHGSAVHVARRGDASQNLESDLRSLHQLARISMGFKGVRRLKDVSRGGLAGALINIAEQNRVNLEIGKKLLPVRREVKRYCMSNGIDPLYVPSAGVLITIAEPSVSEDLLFEWKRVKGGENASIIGMVKALPQCEVTLRESEKRKSKLELKNMPDFIQVG